jgi:hypothetical protein
LLKLFLIHCVSITYAQAFESNLQLKSIIFCSVMPGILVDMYQVWRNLFPKSCGITTQKMWSLFSPLWELNEYLPVIFFFIFPLHIFLSISSMELMELYHHSPMCFRGEHRDRLLTSCSLTWCDPLL